MKGRLMAMAVAAVTAGMAAHVDTVPTGATVTDVTAKQRYPWNGLVDITCTVSGIDGTAQGLDSRCRSWIRILATPATSRSSGRCAAA